MWIRGRKRRQSGWGVMQGEMRKGEGLGNGRGDEEKEENRREEMRRE